MKARTWMVISLFWLTSSISTAHTDTKASSVLAGDFMASYKAEALLQQVAGAYEGAHTLSGTLTQCLISPSHLAVTERMLALQKPASFSLDFLAEQQIESQDTGEVTAWDRDKEDEPAPRKSHMLKAPSSLLVILFYFPDELPKLDFLKRKMYDLGGKVTIHRHYAGYKIIGGVSYEVVKVDFTTLLGPTLMLDFYIGPDKFIHRLTSILYTPGRKPKIVMSDEMMAGLTVNAPVPTEPVSPDGGGNAEGQSKYTASW